MRQVFEVLHGDFLYNVIQISQLITLMNFLLTWILIAGYVGGTNPAASK